MAVSANRTELLQIADAVARDKSIDKSVVLHAMEEAMQRAAKAHYGSENEIKVEIDPEDRRDPCLALSERGRAGRQRQDRDFAGRRAHAQSRRPRWATSSPRRCRRSISTASMRRTPSR